MTVSARSRCVHLSALLSFLLCAMASQAGQNPAPIPRLPLLTRVEQIRNLTLDEANLGYPVRVRGVVTYFNLKKFDLFIQDFTAGVWVDNTKTKLVVKPGQLVEVEGDTAAPDFAPQVSKPRIRILGRAPMPVARRVSFNRMSSTKEDSQWVEVEGIVHIATKEGESLWLDVGVDGGRLIVEIPDFRQPIPPPLVDAKVRIHGACGAIFNRKNQLIGVILYVPGLTEVHVLEPPPADPFAIPARPIASLLRFTPKGASGHRVKVRGVVTLPQPGRSLFIKDETGGLYVHSQQMTTVQAGDRVEVAGFPSVGEYSAVLEDAVFRRIGTGPSPAPAPVTAAQALDGSHDADKVRIQARLLDVTSGAGQHALNMKADNVIFVSQLEDTRSRKSLAALAPGSLLQLTGICMVEADENRTPRSFRILLRSPDDIVLLERPPWWTTKHVARTMVIMAALIFAVLLWAVMLKRQVHEKTESIRGWLQREIALKALYQELFENANDMVFTCDLQGHFTSLNKAGLQITGYTKTEAVGINFADIVAPECSALARQMIQEGAQEGAKTYELEIVTKEGRRVCLDLGTRVICREGMPVAVQGIARDITERKRTHDALRQAEDRYRSIFENSADGIFQTAPGGQLLAANHALAQMLGYESPQQLSENLKDVQRSWVEPERRSEFKRLLEERDAVEGFEFEVYRKDGSKIWISENSHAVRDANGELIYYEGTWRDISQGRRLEEQLRQAQKVEAVGQLAGGIAHDFNNLLTIISGYSQLVLGSAGTDQRLQDHVREVLKAADRAASLTAQLLAFSRRQVLTPQVLDLDAVVASMDKMLPCLIGENHELAIVKGKQLGRVMADSVHIEQVIVNLAVNARDAMPEGGRLTIETGNFDLDEGYARSHFGVTPGPYVMLAVSDTGCGMDAETQAHMFDPFFTTKEPGKGTGLGLATVYGIVKQSGGYIGVYSEPGRGTTFKIYLPRIDRAVQVVQPAQTQTRTEMAKGSETVLVVEDEHAVRSLVRGVLESSGYSVLEARHGPDALSLCGQHKGAINLLLTDVVMPQMNGRELAEHLAPLHARMKVLYMSGYSDGAFGKHRILDPRVPLIKKPFTPDALARKVREVLDA